jgi:hypothetical protein
VERFLASGGNPTFNSRLYPARKVRALSEKRTRGPRGTALNADELKRFSHLS